MVGSSYQRVSVRPELVIAIGVPAMTTAAVLSGAALASIWEDMVSPAIAIAATNPTITILRWVVRSAL